MKLLPFLCATIIGLASAHGATIAWSGATDNGFTLADGVTMLPVNSLVRLGYFDISDAAIQQNFQSNNFAFLESNFHQLDFDRIGGAEVGGKAGYFAESENVVSGSIAGKQLVIWAYSSSDNSSLSQSLATAMQMGIFYMDKAVDSNWAIPGELPPAATAIDLTNLTGATPTSDLLTGAHLVVGSYTSTPAGQFNARNFALEVVPEPTTTGLAVVGGVAMLLRRRRRA